MEQEFKAWCLVIEPMLLPIATWCLGICACICVITHAWGKFQVAACVPMDVMINVCDGLQVFTLMSPQCGLF